MNLISFSIAKTGQRSGGMVWNDTCRQGEWTYHHVCFSPSPLPFHFMSALPSPDFQQALYPSCLHFHHVFSIKTITVSHLLRHYIFHQILYSLPLSVVQQVLRRFMFCVRDRLFSPRLLLFFVKSITVQFCFATAYFSLQVPYLFTSANFQSRFHWNNTTLSTITHIISDSAVVWLKWRLHDVHSGLSSVKIRIFRCAQSGIYGFRWWLSPRLLVASAPDELGVVVR